MSFSYEKQKTLIEQCIANNLSLSDELSKLGLDYDSLSYSNEEGIEKLSALPDFIPVDERPKIASGIPCVSFFSGAGGLDIGFECAGFKTIADVEIVPMFCDTLRKNGHSTKPEVMG